MRKAQIAPLLLAATLFAPALTGQTPQLVKDFYPYVYEYDCELSEAVQVGNRLITNAKDLWASTASLTVLDLANQKLERIWLATQGRVDVDLMTRVGSDVLLRINESTEQQLWVTDGSAAGTQQLTGIDQVRAIAEWNGAGYILGRDSSRRPAIFRYDPKTRTHAVIVHPPVAYFTNVLTPTSIGLWFVGNTSNGKGEEPFFTDGTAAGTRTIGDIMTGVRSSYPLNFTELGGKVYFSAIDSAHGRELWVSDGTTQGTQLLVDLWPGMDSGVGLDMTVMGGKLYFGGRVAAGSFGLFESDGTATGTKSVTALAGFGDLERLTVLGQRILFRFDDAFVGKELFVSDGTASGTGLLKDISPGKDPSEPGGRIDGPFVVVGNHCFFVADDGTHGEELWASDGTAAGTRLVADLNGPSVQSPFGPVIGAAAGVLVLGEVPGNGRQPYLVDPQTLRVSQMGIWTPPAGYSSEPEIVGKLGPYALITLKLGSQTWLLDLRTDQVYPLSHLTPEAADWQTIFPIEGGVRFDYFYVRRSTYMVELWRIDDRGRAERVFKTNYRSMLYDPIVELRDRFFIVLNDTWIGNSLWECDGTPWGLKLVMDPSQDPYYGLRIRQISRLGDLAAFRMEGWREDRRYFSYVVGDGGLMAPFDLFGRWLPLPKFLGSCGKQHVFVHSTKATGAELWVTDGTVAGARMLLDYVPGAADSEYLGFQVIGNRFYSHARGSGRWSLVESDGSVAGTRLLPLESGFTPGEVHAVANGRLFLDGHANQSKTGLFSYDPRSNKLEALLSGTIDHVQRVGSRRVLFRGADYQANKASLYISDGTKAGTGALR
jgi:ELWxxDGT repeat protein